MIKLHTRRIERLSDGVSQTCIVRLTDGLESALPLEQSAFIVRNGQSIPDGMRFYFFFDRIPPIDGFPPNSFLLPEELNYLVDGDIIRFSSERLELRVIYRRRSKHNSMLVTERCNNFCVMCSQPPRDIDDSFLVDELLEAIPMMNKETVEIGITGGEPTLLGTRFLLLVEQLRNYLPTTSVHVLSNGRRFADATFCEGVAALRHPDLMIGIPLYSDISNLHDYVVQADGAFDETVRGILQLKQCGVAVEIRVVIHRQTYERLPQLARYIVRNLLFVDHVALMGLEMIGFTRANLDALWIDPVEYQTELTEAVRLLSTAGIATSIYNHQLCLLSPELYPWNRKSISDWKNEYMKECQGCVRQDECGGFFSSAKYRYSDFIRPFCN